MEWCYLIQLAGYEIWYDECLQFGHHINSSRLQWSYYVKLKSGIAAGAAKLDSYHPFFRRKNPGIFNFLGYYFSQMLKSQFLFLKYRFLNTQRNMEVELGRAIINSKARAYRRDFLTSLFHFQRTQKFLKSFVGK